MNPQPLHQKVQAFVRRLLDKANGDPARALGLLVLVLDDSEPEFGDQMHRLVAEVRKVLMQEPVIERSRPIQHPAGTRHGKGAGIAPAVR